MNLKAVPSINPTSLAKIALFGLLLAGLYHSALTWLVTKDWAREGYSHCYLMPFVVLYLIYDKRTRLTEFPSSPSWKGLILLGVGLALFWLGELGGEYLTLYISFWVVLVGLLWIHLGWKKMRTITFALFIALTMFPLPNFLYNQISVKLQLISSRLGVGLMQLYGMSAHRQGNVIDLGFTQLQVVEACSGIRSLMSITVLGLLMAYLFRARFWKRALLLCSTVPLSIFANGLRLASTAVLYEICGREVAEGFFHGFSGWIIFVLVCAILVLEMWILKNIGRPPSFKSAPQSNPSSSLCRNLKPRMKKGLKDSFQPQFIAAIALLLPTLVVSQGIEFRTKVPISKSLDQFPLQVGKWIGTRQGMEQRFVDRLGLSDYVIIDFRNPTSEAINFYVAYYESQRKGESIHSPGTCLPGSGWIFREAGTITFSTPGRSPGSMKVNRSYMEKMGSKQLSYYWFPQRGRILNNAYQLKMYAFWDALTKQRTDGALVRLITPVSESEELKQADARLQEFTRLIVPALEEYILAEEVEELRN